MPDPTPTTPEIMIFRPTWSEFKDFMKYIEFMESMGAHHAGIAKIIPPPEWKPRPTGYGPLANDLDEDDAIGNLIITAPIRQTASGQFGIYQMQNLQRPAVTVRRFYEMTNSRTNRPPAQCADLEQRFWRSVPYSTEYTAPMYGADVAGSLMDAQTAGAWNVNRLQSLLDVVATKCGVTIAGVNSPYLYFGMWRSTFAWHTEDLDLYSINYLHFGASKMWYAVPPSHGRHLERLAGRQFPQQHSACAAHLRHKTTLIDPNVLRRRGVPVKQVLQNAGEFMVTFPFGYHAGYNLGFNCAESTNFATERWIEYGKWASRCACKSDGVRINMNMFVQQFQPQRWRTWMLGLEMGRHPEDDDDVDLKPQRVDEEKPVIHVCSPTRRSCAASMPRLVAEKILHVCSPNKRHCGGTLPTIGRLTGSKKRKLYTDLVTVKSE